MLYSDLTRRFGPTQATDSLYLCRVGFYTPTAAPPHALVQPTAALYLLLNGAATLHCGKRTHTVAAGDLIGLPPYTAHRLVSTDEAPLCYLLFHFGGIDAAAQLQRMGFADRRPVLSLGDRSLALSAVADRLYPALAHEGENAYHASLAAFYEMIALCRPAISYDNAAVRAVIDANYADADFTVEALCREFSVSHTLLCHRFRREYGISMVRYLIHRRLELAQHLLATTDLSVQAVAASSGFSDAPHFMRTFKATCGVTARAYRRARTADLHGETGATIASED